MRRIVLFGAIALACGTSQTRPNFSGSWKLNVARSDLGEPTLRGAIFKIDHREPAFVISRTLLYPSEQKSATFNLRTDGKPLVVPFVDDKLRLALRWDDGSLLCAIREITEAEAAADRVRYSLSSDGRSLTVTEYGKNKPRLWVFERN